jgi:hypothetical protein
MVRSTAKLLRGDKIVLYVPKVEGRRCWARANERVNVRVSRYSGHTQLAVSIVKAARGGVSCKTEFDWGWGCIRLLCHHGLWGSRNSEVHYHDFLQNISTSRSKNENQSRDKQNSLELSKALPYALDIFSR